MIAGGAMASLPVGMYSHPKIGKHSACRLSLMILPLVCKLLTSSSMMAAGQVAKKGKATVESAVLREAMVEYLRAAVSAEPEGKAVSRQRRQPPARMRAGRDA